MSRIEIRVRILGSLRGVGFPARDMVVEKLGKRRDHRDRTKKGKEAMSIPEKYTLMKYTREGRRKKTRKYTLKCED